MEALYLDWAHRRAQLKRNPLGACGFILSDQLPVLGRRLGFFPRPTRFPDYATTGDLGHGVPLVLLHGGPGIPGGAYAPLMEQGADRRAVVRYDQLGCGRSDRPTDPCFWGVPTVVDELAAPRDALGLDRIHLLGHTWGDMLTVEYPLTTSQGVRA